MKLKIFKKQNAMLHPAFNTPKDIRRFFTTPQYKSELAQFLQQNSTLSEDTINDFKNHYLRKHFVSKSDNMNVLLNHGEVLSGLEHIQQLSLSVDDFNGGFASNVWPKLNFSQRYTLLHWLRDSQSKYVQPDIDAVSSLYKKNSFFYYKNSIVMPYQNNCAGLKMADGIIQNTHLYNECNYPTSNGEVKVNGTYTELTDYFYRKNGRQALMGINIDSVNDYDRQDVLRLKNLVVPVTHNPYIGIKDMVMAKSLVRNFPEFYEYFTHELHYTSPLVVNSLKKRVNELSSIVNKKTFPSSDVSTLEGFCNTTKSVSSYEIAPVLRTLDKAEREDLLDTTLRKRYLFVSGKQNTIEYRYLTTLQTEQMKDIYNHVRNEKGELSRV